MLIFLGAGASVPFGPKPYSCIQSEVWELMQKYDVEELCRTAEEKMTSNGVVFDFEAILAMFEFLNDSGKGIQEAGPLLSWLKQDDYLNKIQNTSENAENMITDLKKILFKNCTNIKINKIKKIYDKFFEILKYSEEGHDIDHDIFTTNYDLIIEHYHWYHQKQNSSIKLKTGFEETTSPFLLEFNPKNNYGNHSPDVSRRNIRRLFKLHGSIDQKIQDNTAFKKPLLDNSHTVFDRDMMVFPVAEKYITQYPYYQIYEYLYNAPWTVGTQKETCIVIGFSFRDIPIINAFMNRIIKNNKERCKTNIILIDKNPESVFENLKNRLSKKDYEMIEDKIQPIIGCFGSSSVFNKLEDIFHRKDTNMVQL